MICEGNALYCWGNPVSVSPSFLYAHFKHLSWFRKAKAFTKSISYIAKRTLNSLIGIPWPEITWTNSRRKDKFGVYLCTKADAFLRNCFKCKILNGKAFSHLHLKIGKLCLWKTFPTWDISSVLITSTHAVFQECIYSIGRVLGKRHKLGHSVSKYFAGHKMTLTGKTPGRPKESPVKPKTLKIP